MLVFQDVSCSFSAQKPHLETIARTQEVISVAVQPAAFFRRASGNGGTLAASISSSEHHLIKKKNTSNDYCSNDQSNELLSFLSSFILCLWRASKYMAHCLQVQLDDFSQSASADVGSVLLKLSNLFFVLHKSIYFSNFPKCVEKPSPKFPKV